MVDPGVFVSAIISGQSGTPPTLIMSHLRVGRFTLIMSVKLLEELLEVLMRPKFRRYVTEESVESFLDRLWRTAELHQDPVLPPRQISADPKDDYLIALARSANADVLVSGDRHLTVHEDLDFEVLTPRAFLDVIGR